MITGFDKIATGKPVAFFMNVFIFLGIYAILFIYKIEEK